MECGKLVERYVEWKKNPTPENAKRLMYVGEYFDYDECLIGYSEAITYSRIAENCASKFFRETFNEISIYENPNPFMLADEPTFEEYVLKKLESIDCPLEFTPKEKLALVASMDEEYFEDAARTYLKSRELRKTLQEKWPRVWEYLTTGKSGEYTTEKIEKTLNEIESVYWALFDLFRDDPEKVIDRARRAVKEYEELINHFGKWEETLNRALPNDPLFDVYKFQSWVNDCIKSTIKAYPEALKKLHELEEKLVKLSKNCPVNKLLSYKMYDDCRIGNETAKELETIIHNAQEFADYIDENGCGNIVVSMENYFIRKYGVRPF